MHIYIFTHIHMYIYTYVNIYILDSRSASCTPYSRCCYIVVVISLSTILICRCCQAVAKRSRRPPGITPSSLDIASIGVASTLTVVVTFFPNALNDRLKWLQV